MSAGYQPRRIPCGWRALAIHSFADRVVSRTERKSVLPDVVISTFGEVGRRAQFAARTDCCDSRGEPLVEVGDRAAAGWHEGESGEWAFEADDHFRAVQACRKDLDDVCAGVVGSRNSAERQRAEHGVRPVSMMALATDSETPGDTRNDAPAWAASMACDGCTMPLTNED